MSATTKLSANTPQTVDVYLGFEIFPRGDEGFVAIPRGWTHADVSVLEAPDLPTLRKKIWGWWHRLLD